MNDGFRGSRFRPGDEKTSLILGFEFRGGQGPNRTDVRRTSPWNGLSRKEGGA